MPSPFPGMDPFLETHWGDVHTRLTTYASDQLQPRLPGDLRARIEEYVHLEVEELDQQPRFNPDVRIVERPSGRFPARTATEPSGLIAASPLVITFEVEWTERWIQILDTKGNKVITTIEFLSPGNKRTGEQREQFQRKQRQLLDAGTNLVEIDLLREGRWALSFPEDLLPPRYCYPYRTIIIRAQRPTLAECYTLPLQERLPTIRIPLRESEPDVLLDLQSLIDMAWEAGMYSDTDYASASCPPFHQVDEAWIQERIAAWKAAQPAAS